MPWLAPRLKKDDRSFILFGEGVRMQGTVWRGRMAGDVLFGLKALVNPALRQHLVRTWKISTPRSYAGADNSGDERKVLVLSASGAAGGAAPVVLKFAQTVPPELLRDLKIAFSGRGELSHGKVLGDPERQLGPPQKAPGHRSRRRQPADRHAPEDELDPSLRGQEGKVGRAQPKRAGKARRRQVRHAGARKAVRGKAPGAQAGG